MSEAFAAPVVQGIGVAALVCLALGFRLQRRHPEWSALQRASLFALPTLGLGLGVVCGAILLEMPFADWNGARLASSATLVHGYRLYYGPDEGPAMPTVYGPVSFLLYLPALWLGSITNAILAAGALNIACMVAPLLALHWRDVRVGGWSRTSALLGVVFAVAALIAASPTRAMLSGIHVDAPAVGLGLSACVVLMQAGRRPTLARISSVALLAVLAVWTKQIEVPLLVALPLYAWLRHGLRAAIRLAAASLAIGAALSGVFVACFGFDDLRFNLFAIGAGHLEHFGAAGTPQSVFDLARKSAPFLLFVGVVAQLLRDEREPWRERDWLLPLLVGLLMFPMSAIARSKLGAWENSYHAIYYWIAAASLALAAALRSPGVARPLAAMVAAVVFALACLPQNGLAGWTRLASLRDNPQQQAVDFARAHPGEAYFPWNPLASAYAEGRLYHFDYAVLDRHFAGYPMSEEHIRAFLPDRVTYVLFHERRQDEAMLRYLPEFRARAELPEMPGWIVYASRPPRR